MAWEDATLDGERAPLWLQVADLLRSEIANGRFVPGDVLPSESDLTRTFKISRTTARSALNKLMQEGLIKRRSGVGSVVLDGKVDRPVSQLSGFSEDMKRHGLAASFHLIQSGFSPVTDEAAHALGLAAGDKPFLSERTLFANERLIGHSVSWVRPDIFGRGGPPTADQLTGGSLYAWLSENLGINIVGGVEFIEAQMVKPEMARTLELDVHDAVLIAKRVARCARGLPIEFAVVTYRADRYRVRIDL